eukprot:201872-Chlamydomonas_euryale.AAC.5
MASRAMGARRGCALWTVGCLAARECGGQPWVERVGQQGPAFERCCMLLCIPGGTARRPARSPDTTASGAPPWLLQHSHTPLLEACAAGMNASMPKRRRLPWWRAANCGCEEFLPELVLRWREWRRWLQAASCERHLPVQYWMLTSLRHWCPAR